MGSPGDWIRRLREERGFTREQVEDLTREFAQKTGNEHNWIRHGRLAHIERGDAVPDIYTVQSFAEVYQVTYERVLQGFGIDIPASRHLLGTSSSLLTPSNPFAILEPRRMGVSSLRQISSQETRLLTNHAENAEVLQTVLGLEFDEVYTIGERAEWQDLIERPIYFVWHEEGYSCCWCDQRENKLILLPHPASHRSAMQLTMPGQATIIGRVTHVWSPLPGIEASK